MKKIYQRVSQRTGYDEEKIEFVVKEFFKTLQFYLRNPHLTKAGITIKNFFSFKLRRKAVEKRLIMVKQEKYIKRYQILLDLIDSYKHGNKKQKKVNGK